MLRRIGTALVVVPLAVIMIAFAIANRQWVILSLDPFSSAEPAYAASMPLFALIFASLILGVLIGGLVAWLGQAKWRRGVRRLDNEIRLLRQELETARRGLGSGQGALSTAHDAARGVISPSAF